MLIKHFYKGFFFCIEENVNILKTDSNNLTEQLVQNNDINECIKSVIDGKNVNEIEVPNDTYM